MATATQSSSTQPSPPSNDSSSGQLSWDGDRMFNIYIYDYCTKRGYRKTARELMNEAELGGDTVPPINARQGLLYEWWSVFWVLFSAKANNGGSEEAQTYMQNYMARQNSRGIQLNQAIALNHGQQPMQPQPPPMGRLANGPNRPGPLGFPANGIMPNGAGPQPGMNPFPMGGPQPNGIPGQPGGPPHPPGSIPPGQPQNAGGFLVPGGQRPIAAGMGQPGLQTPTGQRHPNGPFSSPTIANSPQNPSGSQQPGQQQNPQLQQPPMSQLGPSPHLSHTNRTGGMLPVNQGMNPMNSQQPGAAGQQNPQPGGQPSNPFPQPGQTPSRSGTPGQPQHGGVPPGGGNMMHPSPSMGNRQPPMAAIGGTPQTQIHELNQLYSSIPPMILQQIQKELGFDGKDINTLNPTDKQRIVSIWRTRHPQNGMNPVRGQMGRNPQQGMQQQQPQPQPQQRGKRSPGDDDTPGRSDTSPPERKRARPDPGPNQNPQPMTSPYPNPQQTPQPPPGQPGGPGGPQQGGMPPGMMMAQRGGGPMPMLGMGGNPQIPPQGMPPGQPGMGGGPMGMGGPMGGMGPSPGGAGMPPGMQGGMNPQMGPPGSMTPHMHNQPNPHMRIPGKPGVAPGMVANAQSPAAGDGMFMGPQLGPGPGGGPGFNQPNRMPPGAKMMGNPSPGMQPKDTPGGPSAPGQNQGQKGPLNMESPRNPPNPQPGQGPNPPNPGAGPSGSNQPGPMGGNPGLNPAGMLGPQPGSMGPPSGSQGQGGGLPVAGDLFSTDFITSVASSLDDFDSTNLFRPDGDINFERDFGQWFNGDDGINPLDMK